VLFDLKHMDARRHEQLTGVSNELILENVRRAYRELALPMRARIPVIPGVNDAEANVAASAKFVADALGDSVEVHLLPYNRLGEAKHRQLETAPEAFSADPPTADHMSQLKRLVESYGLVAHIDG